MFAKSLSSCKDIIGTIKKSRQTDRTDKYFNNVLVLFAFYTNNTKISKSPGI